MLDSSFWRNTIYDLKGIFHELGNLPDALICVGLGSPSAQIDSIHQLCLLRCLMYEFTKIANVQIWDPVLDNVDIELLTDLKITAKAEPFPPFEKSHTIIEITPSTTQAAISDDKNKIYTLPERTSIVYMPHCVQSVHEIVLRSFFREDQSKTDDNLVVIGNKLCSMTLKSDHQSPNEHRSINIQRTISLVNYSAFPNAFKDQYMQLIYSVKCNN
ncbi:hypothetical protein GJ496_006093 [Pomphorhynchus laevis]|nr:hypothetical protein GJ496_006093 [Pomphorhynchus laevis]